MISAEEAYRMAMPRLDEYRDFIDSEIRKAVAEHKVDIIIRKFPYGNWLYNESKLEDPDAKRVIKELRQLGYVVTGYYREDIQFVDMGLQINWDKNLNSKIAPETK